MNRYVDLMSRVSLSRVALMELEGLDKYRRRRAAAAVTGLAATIASLGPSSLLSQVEVRPGPSESGVTTAASD